MTQEWPIRSKEDLLAHAIAIEREAAARYAELGERMGELGNDVVAQLFLRLARLEKEHAQELERRAAGMALPQIAPGEYAWFATGAPETAAHDLVLNLITPVFATAFMTRLHKRLSPAREILPPERRT